MQHLPGTSHLLLRNLNLTLLTILINMKLSYIFSLLPLVAANDGYLFEDHRHHLRRALTAEGVGCECNSCSASCAPRCSEEKHCAELCPGESIHTQCDNAKKCATCVSFDDSNYEVMETGDGWEDVDGDYILEKE